MQRQYISFILISIVVASCSTGKKNNYQPGAAAVSLCTNSMSSIMIHDVTNPPLAARFFAYSFLAGYEVVAQNDSSFKSMHGVLNKYPLINKPPIENYNYQIAALYAVLETAGKLQPSGKLLDSVKQSLSDSFVLKGVSKNVINKSKQYG